MYFDELDLEDEVLDGLEAMNFFETTPVQEATIPLLLEGRDMIGCAQTGTGKTAAYLLPIINRLSRGEGDPTKVNALIMAPTRELAIQIEQQVEGFSYFLPISSVAIYGGTDGIAWEQQRRGMDKGADIVIATPGRLISLLNLQQADLSGVHYFVLDEADRMLDMGFQEDILQIYKALPEDCQHVMFSATMPPRIKKFAHTILRNPAEVELAISRPPESIVQSAYVCYEAQKVPILTQLFHETPPTRTIIFSSSKLKVKELARTLSKLDIRVEQMHSDLTQEKREEVMRSFKAGTVDLLVATDVVARGIDIDNIRMVINFDIPHDPEDYVHRIGRTARGGNDEGLAITFVSEREQYGFGRIEDFLGREIYKIPVDPSFGPVPSYDPSKRVPSGRGGGRSGGGGGRSGGSGRSGGGRSGGGRKEGGRGPRPEGAKAEGQQPREGQRPKGAHGKGQKRRKPREAQGGASGGGSAS
ncbi:DEAD/DEAH box helicase [Porphyromonas sp. oral taxon 275]|uniref:DEAD/DEAH box helicase n=1 Tax=Porphyromonas sp. oral taxon 275 TaxID=712435 RepID=UPI001BAC2FB3|nr:DEAD/DEAH box helicase [Porphyromonas sp. oral taxon 275]QUB42688.1 DEAD/DEAH box helicase [Porphyromonas sp. oral taxon 275]